MPGGVRQSTCRCAASGITFISCEASTIVGTRVTRIIASASGTRAGARSPSARRAGSGSPSTSSPRPVSSARGAAVTSQPGLRVANASSSGASFSSALSPRPGTDAWPAIPSVLSVKRYTPFSPMLTE